MGATPPKRQGKGMVSMSLRSCLIFALALGLLLALPCSEANQEGGGEVYGQSKWPEGGGGGGGGGGGRSRALSEDDAYSPDDDLEGLRKFRERADAAAAEDRARAQDSAQQAGEEMPPEEEGIRELDDKVSNMTHIALLKVMALSWPSEGEFGSKVEASLPPSSGLDYSWTRANRKALRIITEVDHKTMQAPSEEILLALGYRHFHGIGTSKFEQLHPTLPDDGYCRDLE